MSDIGMNDAVFANAAPRRDRKPQRARLGKTWQDRNWRQRVVAQIPSRPLYLSRHDDATGRRALPSRHN